MGLSENAIPEEKLPHCWSDDVRMNALFAPFRIKSANPESWDMKMKFWSDMLRQWCKFKNDPVVSASDAKFAFQRKGRTPACIDIVVEEMIRNGDLSPLSKYTQILHNGPEGWVKWGARLAFKPAAFALTAAVSLLPARQALDSDGLPKASIDSTHRFVLESAVKEQATMFLENFPNDEERIGTIEDLIKRSNWQQSWETFEVLLGWLVAQGEATKKDNVVKLAEPRKKISPITEADEALVKLMSAETRLCGDMARLEREVNSCNVEARAALKLGNKPAAKNHLRKKHKAQQRLNRCEAALDNVRQLLLQLKDVDTNATIVDTYKTSSQAMKHGMKESGLDEDTVHETMEDLKEVLESYSDVERALSTTVDDFDAAELEQELKDLLSSPGTPNQHTPIKGNKTAKPIPESIPSPNIPRPSRLPEREFIFDGEERMMAELDALEQCLDIDTQKSRKKQKENSGEKIVKEKVAVPADWGEPQTTEIKASKDKSWYPPSSQFLNETWNNNQEYREVRQDDRLHPGQPLNLDFSSPPRLYSNNFQVQDHKMAEGVFLYNKDTNSNVNDLGSSTEYVTQESESKAGGSFQMAPGGERKASATWTSESAPWSKEIQNDSQMPESTFDDLERRLRDLRGFNL